MNQHELLEIKRIASVKSGKHNIVQLILQREKQNREKKQAELWKLRTDSDAGVERTKITEL